MATMAEGVVIHLPVVRTCLDCHGFEVMANGVGWCLWWQEEVLDDSVARSCPKFERLEDM